MSQDQAMKLNSTVTTATKRADMGAFLRSRSLCEETASRLGLTELGGRIEIPYNKNGERVYSKFRGIAEKTFSCEAGHKPFMWNFDVIHDETIGQSLLITEGEFDALAAIQSGHIRTVSVPNGSQGEGASLAYLDDVIEDLKKEPEILLAFDDDEKGHALLHAFWLRLGRARLKWIKYPKGCKDLNDALMQFGEKGVQESIKRAAWLEINGDYSLKELPPVPYARPYSVGIHGMQINCRMGDFSIITGVPSCGKSTFVNDILCRMITNQGLKPAIASFEQPPQSDHRRALRTWYHKRLERDLDDEQKQSADDWIDRNFRFIVPNEDDNVTLEWLLERMTAVVVRRGCNMIVIDPWNEMDHDRPSDMTTTEYVGHAIRELKRFAKKYMVHVMVIAHPAKMRRDKDGQYPIPTLYDVSDSAHWYNKADLGIVVHRSDDGDIVQVCKSRYHTEIGKPTIYDVSFDVNSGRYQVIDRSVLDGYDKGR